MDKWGHPFTIKKLAGAEHARVTVRIKQEEAPRHERAAQKQADDLLFGMWRDREDMADVEAYCSRRKSTSSRR